jgi:hypothetical protein
MNNDGITLTFHSTMYTIPLLTVQMFEMFDTMDKDNYSVIVGEIELLDEYNMYGGKYNFAGKKNSSKVVFYNEQDALIFKLKFNECILSTNTMEYV